MTPSASIHNKKSGGYVLLLSVIFLSVIATVIVGSLLLLGLGRAQTGQALEQADQARYYAEACAETALDDLRQNSGYAGNEVLSVGGAPAGSCRISPVTFTDPDYNIQASAAVGAAAYSLLVQAQLETSSTSSTTLVQVDSWLRQ